jgi:tyrosyl-tRNA synthetase
LRYAASALDQVVCAERRGEGVAVASAGIAIPQILELASAFTVQQFLSHDSYRRRMERGDPIRLHEILYALLQGYDAVHLRADVRLGATEQLFNIMAAPSFRKRPGSRPASL